MEYPRLPECPTLGTLTGNVYGYYLEKAKNENHIRIEILGERENEELMGKSDGAEYMNEVNWPEKN